MLLLVFQISRVLGTDCHIRYFYNESASEQRFEFRFSIVPLIYL